MKVLVVEDEALSALALVEALAQAGHHILGPAANSMEALTLARTQLTEAAFVDVDLEETGAGLRLARELIELRIPVVFTTGRPQSVRDAGVGFALIAKPYDTEHAVEALAVIQAFLAGERPESVPASMELLDRPGESPPAESRQQPILLVEDHPKDIELTTECLQSVQSAPITVARDGREAIDRLLKAAARPESLPLFVLLDLKMPRMDGFEVLARVKRDARLQSVPIIVFTSSIEEVDIKRCYALGANAVISKPRDMREFKNALQAIAQFWTR